MYICTHQHGEFQQCLLFVFVPVVSYLHTAILPYPQGQNIVLNMNDHGFVVCAYNRTVAKVDQFLANEAKGESLNLF